MAKIFSLPYIAFPQYSSRWWNTTYKKFWKSLKLVPWAMFLIRTSAPKKLSNRTVCICTAAQMIFLPRMLIFYSKLWNKNVYVKIKNYKMIIHALKLLVCLLEISLSDKYNEVTLVQEASCFISMILFANLWHLNLWTDILVMDIMQDNTSKHSMIPHETFI